MNNEEIYDAQVKTQVANKALLEIEPMAIELLNATRKETTQTSLDEFGAKMNKSGGPIAKETVAPKLVSELLSLDDITKMLLED